MGQAEGSDAVNTGRSGDSAVDQLRRWELFGGHWRIRHRTQTHLALALLTCDGGEEVDRVETDDPALIAYVGFRNTDQDDAS